MIANVQADGAMIRTCEAGMTDRILGIGAKPDAHVTFSTCRLDYERRDQQDINGLLWTERMRD